MSFIIGAIVGLLVAWWVWPQPEWAVKLREWLKTNTGV